MLLSSSRIIQLLGLSTVAVVLVFALHFYNNSKFTFSREEVDNANPKQYEVALGPDDLEKLRPHFGHVLLEERARLKRKAALQTKKIDPWASQGEYKYPVEREIQQPSPFPVLRPLRGPPPSSKQKPRQDFVEEPHRLLKALPTFDRAGKLIYPNIEDEEPLNFDN